MSLPMVLHPHHADAICQAVLLTGAEGKDFMETQKVKPRVWGDESELICDYDCIS